MAGGRAQKPEDPHFNFLFTSAQSINPRDDEMLFAAAHIYAKCIQFSFNSNLTVDCGGADKWSILVLYTLFVCLALCGGADVYVWCCLHCNENIIPK